MNQLGANTHEGDLELSADEKSRLSALRRFNTLTVYLPATLAVLLALAALVGLAIALFGDDNLLFRQDASALADISIAILCLPILLLWSLVPISLIVLGIQLRKQDSSIAEKVHMSTRRVRDGLEKADSQIARFSQAAARPVISLHSRGAYLQSLIRFARRRLKRS